MKNDKIVPGLILVLIGAAILLANFGYLHFHWYNVWRLWPVFLVIGGVNLVLSHHREPWATAIRIAVVVLGLGLILFGNFGNRGNFWPGFTYSVDDNDNNDDESDNTDSKNIAMNSDGMFTEPYTTSIKYAQINISGGGSSYALSDTTNQLFKASTPKGNTRYQFSHHMDDSTYVLEYKMHNHRGFNFNTDDKKNNATFYMNPNPEWTVHVETGAAKVDFDLSKFKIREVSLDGGAASFNVKLGAPLTTTNVDISTGLADVNIQIPQNAACSIDSDSGLSDNHYEGFTKTSDNNYETPGYANAKNKIHIHISGGLSDFKVKRY